MTVPALLSYDEVTATQTVNGTVSPESAAVVVLIPAPAIFKAPAQGDTYVRVQDLAGNATQAIVVVNGTTTFTAAATGDDPGRA